MSRHSHTVKLDDKRRLAHRIAGHRPPTRKASEHEIREAARGRRKVA